MSKLQCRPPVGDSFLTIHLMSNHKRNWRRCLKDLTIISFIKIVSTKCLVILDNSSSCDS